MWIAIQGGHANLKSRGKVPGCSYIDINIVSGTAMALVQIIIDQWIKKLTHDIDSNSVISTFNHRYRLRTGSFMLKKS